MFIKSFILTAALLNPPAVMNGNNPGSWCTTAIPIYVQAEDYKYLQSTDHGNQLLDWIETHNQKIVDLCGNLPRTIIK